MFLSAVWTLILTAPIHCRGEQVMQCYISQNLFLMMKQTHLHLEWPWGEYIFIFEWTIQLTFTPLVNISSKPISDTWSFIEFKGYEGRTGMATITLKKDHQFEPDAIFSHVTTYLPSYARPRFIRIQVTSQCSFWIHDPFVVSVYLCTLSCLSNKSKDFWLQDCLAVTCTFKQLKGNLVEEGFNPAVITDPLFVLDETVKSYRPLTRDTYQSILDAHFRLWRAGCSLS